MARPGDHDCEVGDEKGLWEPQPRSLLQQCAREIADAFRQEYYTDPQGRRVRRNHALKTDTQEQLALQRKVACGSARKS